MVRLIMGANGAGKTKQLIDLIDPQRRGGGERQRRLHGTQRRHDL